MEGPSLMRMGARELRKRRGLGRPLHLGEEEEFVGTGPPSDSPRKEGEAFGFGFGATGIVGGAGGLGSALSYLAGDGMSGSSPGGGGGNGGSEAAGGRVTEGLLDRLLVRHQGVVPYLVFAVAAFTRFYRLSEPGGICFDESHFVRFTNQYTARTYFFDIHPPLGKLTLWFAGQIAGLNQPDPTTRPFMSLKTDCNYEHISEDYADGCPYPALRSVAALHSSLTVVLLYLIARNWGASVWGGLLAAGLLLFDMLNNIQGRLILLDVQLSFWTMMALYVAQLWWKRLDRHADAEDAASAALADAETAALVSSAASAAAAARGPPRVSSAASLAASLSPAPPMRKSSTGGGGGAGVMPSSASAGSLSSSVGSPTPHAGNPPSTPSAGPPSSSSSSSAAAAASSAAASGPSSSEPPSFFAAAAAAAASLALSTSTSPSLLTERERTMWCVVVGVVCGNAFSVKMTGLVTPFLIAVESFFAIFFLKRGAPFLDLIKILVVAFLTYALWFAVHFALLTRHGDGDEEFTTPQFQSTLLESKLYDPTARWEGFWWTFYTLNRRMIVHNANILAPHPWMSSWWEWVLNLRGVSYYGKDRSNTYTNAVYLIGNHALHYAVLAGLAVFLACGGMYLRLRTQVVSVAASASSDLAPVRAFFAQGVYLLLGYGLNLLPYLGVARSTFIYHYMPALLYAELLLARTVEHVAGRAYTPAAVKAVLLVVGLVWLHYTPWIYGFALTNDGHARRRWMPRWD
jgi:dolichyl-phosphate-mannose--protein O-mannosyl transferase